MNVRCEDYDNISVLALSGELTTESVELFREQAQTRLDKKINYFVIELQHLIFFDSKGLESLIWLQEACDEQLGQMRLCKPDETCRKILHVTRLDNRFDIFDDVTEAVKTMR